MPLRRETLSLCILRIKQCSPEFVRFLGLTPNLEFRKQIRNFKKRTGCFRLQNRFLENLCLDVDGKKRWLKQNCETPDHQHFSHLADDRAHERSMYESPKTRFG